MSLSDKKRNECTIQVYPNVLKEAIGAAKTSANAKETDSTGATRLTRPILVGSIDQGTSSTRFVVFTAGGKIAASAQVEFEQIYPDGPEKVGWHEHDPLVLYSTVVSCVESLAFELRTSHSLDLATTPLAAVGITNQRETTIAWNAKTGKPYHNAIVWDDTRTVGVARKISSAATIEPSSGHVNAGDRIRAETGLPVASYFAGTKVRWLLDHVPKLRNDLRDPSERNNVRFGTVDTWLAYQLTGSPPSLIATGANVEGAPSPLPSTSSSPMGRGADATEGNVGGVFVTDASNASRWLLLNIRTLRWDASLVRDVCGPDHDVPIDTALPCIVPSSGYVGRISPACGCPSLAGVTIGAILGDQQSALFGQCAFDTGEAKCTYGTGMFLMMCTGEELVRSERGLLTTVAYEMGPKIKHDSCGEVLGGGGGGGNAGKDGNGEDDNGGSDTSRRVVQYALEGSVSHSGSTIQWLRDRLCVLSSASESQVLASSIKSNDGLYFVPAFAGLFAPRWRPDARACIVGMTTSHTKSHVARAALEACAYQARELLDCIKNDSPDGVDLVELKVDGGMTMNEWLMQFQSDMIGKDVVRPEVMETTALGAAFAAGLAAGVWSDFDELRKLWKESRRWSPTMNEKERERNWKGWGKAVERSLGWVDDEDESDDGGEMEGEKKAAQTKTWSSMCHEPFSSRGAALLGTISVAAFVAGALVGKQGRR